MTQSAEESKHQLLDQAERIVACLKADDMAQATVLIDDLTGMREAEIFLELGKITRELHEALSGFQVDARVTELAESEMPSATERLNYVIQVTEESANTTLSAVEETVPLAERMEERGKELKEKWQRFKGRQMTINEFKLLSAKIEEYLDQTTEDSTLLQEKLNDVLMAQGFQDITGQIIRHVINLVQEVEENMVSLIRAAGTCITPESTTVAAPAEEEETTSQVLDGPVVPGVNDDDGKVSGQDEVDDLLSSLGF